MTRGHPSPYALGVEFGPSSLRCVEVERLRKGFRLHQCCEGSYPKELRFRGGFDSQIKKTLARTLQSLLKTCQPRSRKVTIGLDSRFLLFRRIPVDSWLKRDDLRDQVLWEAKKLLIDPLDKYVVDFHLQSIDTDTREVLLVIVRKEIVEGYVEVAQQAGLEPLYLDVDLFAMSNAYEYISEGQINGPAAVIDIEGNCLRCVVVSDNMFWFGRTVEMTSRPDLEKLMENAAACDGKTGPTHPFAEILLCGREARSEEIAQSLTRFSPSVRVAAPFEKMKLRRSVSKQQIQRDAPVYMVGTGLALRGATEQ